MIMVTKRTELRVFLEHAMCECGGELLPKPKDPYEPQITVAIWPPPTPKYDHICSKCGKVETFLEIYPKRIYEEIGHETPD